MTSTHWSTADIPDQTGRTAVVTGANTAEISATLVSVEEREPIAVIAAAGRLTWRDAGAQFGFWLVAGALVARDVGARRPQAEC